MEVASAAPERGVDRDTENRILARLYGEPLESCPEGLYIPPDALRVFLESFISSGGRNSMSWTFPWRN
jgi:hypothetical protein